MPNSWKRKSCRRSPRNTTFGPTPRAEGSRGCLVVWNGGEVLQVGAAGVLGRGLPRLLRAGRDPQPAADHCILIFLNGGPRHLDMWDMKPDAPQEICGEFRPIPTTVPGM